MKSLKIKNCFLAALLAGGALLATSCTIYDDFDEDLVEAYIAEHSPAKPESSSSEKVKSSSSEETKSSSSEEVKSSSSEEPESSSSSEDAYPCGEPFADTRSKAKIAEYKTVKIGKQCWFAQNLNYDMGEESLCAEGNDENCETYGRLYTWSDANEACPEGSHLPSTEEWAALKKYVSSGFADVAGEVLKNDSGWGEDGNGTNDYGFSALPGGYYNSSKEETLSLHSQGYWWTSSEGTNGNLFGVLWQMKSSSKELSEMEHRKDFAMSARCIVN